MKDGQNKTINMNTKRCSWQCDGDMCNSGQHNTYTKRFADLRPIFWTAISVIIFEIHDFMDIMLLKFKTGQNLRVWDSAVIEIK
jgi:hypothetical protein